jgi:hypothetical protein
VFADIFSFYYIRSKPAEKSLTLEALWAEERRTASSMFDPVVPLGYKHLGYTKVTQFDDLPVSRKEHIVRLDLYRGGQSSDLTGGVG